MKSPSPKCSSLRQADLLRKITEAYELREERLLTQMQSQWVHRYGVSTLPNPCEKNISDKPIEVADSNFVQPQDTLNQNEDFPKDFSDSTTSSESESKYLEPTSNRFEKLGDLVGNCLDEISIALNEDVKKEDVKKEDVEEGKKSFLRSSASLVPPPPPSLSYLRRWLPREETQSTKSL